MASKVKLLPRPVRRWVRRVRDLPTRIREWPEQRRRLGRRAALRLGWSALRYPIGDPDDPPGPLDVLRISGIEHPFWFRPGTSDVQAIRQIFVRREYEMLRGLREVRTILDVGGNIGAAAVFFLHLFPQSRIVAVEPAPGNLAVLEKNLAPYGARAHVVRAAVWPTAASLQIERGFRDGLDWSLQVRPAETGTVPGVTVPRILERHHLGHVDLLKVDIEGAEYELFRGDTSWLDRVAHLCIELHHDAARCAFNAAISGYDCERDERGETTVCANLRVKER